MRDYKKLALLSLTAGSILLTNTIQAADLEASGVNPRISFDDTGSSGPQWYTGSFNNQYLIKDILTDSEVFRSQPGSSAKSTEGSIVVEGNGDMRLANTTVFIDRSSSSIGIGTTSPQVKLDVHGDISAIFDDTSAKNLQTLFIMSANNADSGKKSDAGFVVENARAEFSYAFRTLEKFTRPGETAEIDGGFAISKQATGAQELVLINPTTNDPTKVELHLSSGASNVDGQWENASSRSYKKNIHELSGEDAMQAMRGLTSVTYQFKQDKGNNKMIGFIAEDIPELLATKTRKTVDPLRIVAVLTKAVQEQDKALTSKDKKIAEMEAKADKNSSRLEKLEAQLIKLMMK